MTEIKLYGKLLDESKSWPESISPKYVYFGSTGLAITPDKSVLVVSSYEISGYSGLGWPIKANRKIALYTPGTTSLPLNEWEHDVSLSYTYIEPTYLLDETLISINQNGTVIITADHGNVEEIINLKTGEIDKEHSSFPVPFIVVNNSLRNKAEQLNNNILYKKQISGVLSDIAPTILSFLKLQPNEYMKGINLVKKIL